MRNKIFWVNSQREMLLRNLRQVTVFSHQITKKIPKKGTHVRVNGGGGLHPYPPPVLLLLEAVEEETVKQLVE